MSFFVFEDAKTMGRSINIPELKPILRDIKGSPFAQTQKSYIVIETWWKF